MSLEFDGNDQYVDIATLDKSNLYSFVARIYVNSLADVIYLYFEDGAGYSWMKINTDGSVTASTYDTSDRSYSTAAGKIATGAWYLIVNNVDIANDSRQIYVNVTLEADDTTDVANLGDLLPWRISHSSSAFDGIICDARIYNRVLSLAEIESIYYAQGTDNIVNGLDARLPMNEKPDGGTATVANSVIDISGNGNHGTPVNSPVYRAASLRLTHLYNNLFDIPRSLSVSVHDCGETSDIIVGG